MTQQGVMVALKRVYDEPKPGDGTRVLVERLWPRGLSKERAHVDLWLKEIAPSRELRTWFGHDPVKFTEFCHRYETELASADRAGGPGTAAGAGETGTGDPGICRARYRAYQCRRPARSAASRFLKNRGRKQ